MTTSGGIRNDERAWTWAEVVTESAARAALLRHDGLAGRHVGVLLDNVPEYVFLLGGAALPGAALVGINPTRRGDELAADIRHTDCRCLVTDARHAPLLDGLDLGVPSVLFESTRPVAALVSGTATRRAPAGCPARTRSRPDLHLGFDGAPKAVREDARAGRPLGAAMLHSRRRRLLLHAAVPRQRAVRTSFRHCAGATSRCGDFSASEFLADVRRVGATYFNFVGRALSYVLAHARAADDPDNPLGSCFGTESSAADTARSAALRLRRRRGLRLERGRRSSSCRSRAGAGRAGPPGRATTSRWSIPATAASARAPGFDEDGRLLNAEVPSARSCAASAVRGSRATTQSGGGRRASRNGWYWSGDLGYRDETGSSTSRVARPTGCAWTARTSRPRRSSAILGRFPASRPSRSSPCPIRVSGDQVMAALELRPGCDFEPAAFAAFLDGNPTSGRSGRRASCASQDRSP